jgi:hypothetical protein
MGIDPFSPGRVARAAPARARRSARASQRCMVPIAKQSPSVGGRITFGYLCAKRLLRASDHRGTGGAVPGVALTNLQQDGGERPIMGADEIRASRVGCHVLQTDSVRTVICFGYPRDGRNGANTG